MDENSLNEKEVFNRLMEKCAHHNIPPLRDVPIILNLQLIFCNGKPVYDNNIQPIDKVQLIELLDNNSNVMKQNVMKQNVMKPPGKHSKL